MSDYTIPGNMPSITKRAFSRDQLTEAVRLALGARVDIERAEYNNSGWFNTIYRLWCSDAKSYVIKVFPLPTVRLMRYETDILLVEVEVMRRLESECVLPVPQIVYASSADELLGSPWYLMRALGGDVYAGVRQNLARNLVSEIDVETGRYCRRLNDISRDTFGLYSDRQPRFKSWRDAYCHLVSDVLRDAEDKQVELPLGRSELHDLMLAPTGAFDEVRRPSLVHWDLHDGNIFVDIDGRITGLLDFERCLWADPLMEYNFGRMGLRADFNRGYGFSGEFTSSEGYRRASYDAYLTLIMVVESYFRGFDQAHIDWARAELATDIEAMRRPS
jgi:aminoglycoside phosphotransferase (APT) family kinase protein